MDANAFIELAGRLAQATGSGPAAYRSAVSRAYYGVFHTAMELLASVSHNCPKHNAHDWAKTCLANCDVDEAGEVAILLGNLRESRRDADYKLREAKPEEKNNAIDCVERAIIIRSQLEAISKNGAMLAKVGAGVTAYRKKIREI